MPWYGSLASSDRALALMEDMLSLANHPYYGWDLDLDSRAAYEQYRPRVFMDFFDLFYRVRCEREDKRRFVCKENNLFDFAFQLVQYYDQPAFIYLHRDPRDYAASFMNVPAGFKTAYSAAMNWKEEQEKCETLISAFNLPAHCVRYRDLVTRPEETIQSVLSFLGEPTETACFQVQTDKNQDLSRNVYWQNLARPILNTNTGKYRQQFDFKTIQVVETVAREPMLRLGYTFETNADWQKPHLFHLRHALASRWNRSRLQTTHAKTYRLLLSRNRLISAIIEKRKQEWIKRQL